MVDEAATALADTLFELDGRLSPIPDACVRPWPGYAMRRTPCSPNSTQVRMIRMPRPVGSEPAARWRRCMTSRASCWPPTTNPWCG